MTGAAVAWSRVARPDRVGIAGIAMGVVAAWLALPPVATRVVAAPLALAAVGAVAGAWAVRSGQRRLGWGAVASALLGGSLAFFAGRASPGHLDLVVSWGALTAAMFRYATPLTFAAIGGLFSERSGVVNIGLEGMMLAGAFFSIWGDVASGSWLVGLVAGVLAGGALALVYAVFAIHVRVDQVVGGTAINLLALGITGYAFLQVYGVEGTPGTIPQIPDVRLPLGWIPPKGAGAFLDAAIGQLNLLIWVSLAVVLLAFVAVFRTPLGLRLRACGEYPLAADAAGVSVYATRYAAVTLSGMLAALGGVYLTLGFVHSFNDGMTNGRGFIALAALIFGRWRPLGALGAALLFGLSSAIADRLAFAWGTSWQTLFQALPYVLTLVAVAGVIGRSVPPAAVGRPYGGATGSEGRDGVTATLDRYRLLQRAGGMLAPLLTAALAFLLGGIVIVATTGKSPWGVYSAIFDGAGLNWVLPWTSGADRVTAGYNLQQTLLLTTALMLTGLAVALPFRAGMFNIGGQGQYLVGSVFAVWIGSSFTSLDPVAHILLATVVASAAGAAWAAVAGILRATVGAHEVITTIMLNWIAIKVAIVLFGQGGPLQSPTAADNPISRDVVDAVKLPIVWGDPLLQGLSIGIFVSLAALVVYWLVMRRTTFGFAIRVVGENAEAARYAGIAVGRNLAAAMAVSGAFAGLAGALDILGWQFRISTSDVQASQIGFIGIAVALLGRNRALGVGLAALLFAALASGTSTRNLDPSVFQPELASNLTLLIQGLVVLFVGADVVVVVLLDRVRRRLRRA